MMGNTDIVTENLYAFYLGMGDHPGMIKGETLGVKWLRSQKWGWPDYLLGESGVVLQDLQQLSIEMEKGKIPAFWIVPDREDSKFENLALDYGIRKVNYWRGMEMDIDSLIPVPEKPVPLSVIRIESLSELKPWLTVVNNELITGKKIHTETFQNLLTSENYNLWALKWNDQMVSVLLVFQHKGILGIYLVATKREMRRKGYANHLLSHVINYYIQKGYNKFVLHSTKNAYPLYKKAGFTEKNSYGIYWKVGKF